MAPHMTQAMQRRRFRGTGLADVLQILRAEVKQQASTCEAIQQL